MLELGYDVDVAYLKEEEVIIKNVTSDCFDCYPLNKWNKLFFLPQ